MHKSTLITYFIKSLLKKHSPPSKKKKDQKIRLCSPVFPSQFQYFQRNFVPSFPNSRTKQNLSENLSSIAGYKKPF